jgi:hypothetical protein
VSRYEAIYDDVLGRAPGASAPAASATMSGGAR